MTNTSHLSFSMDVSPIEFVKLMFENTDENGNLYLTDWYDVEKDDTTSFKDYSCKIKWAKEDVEDLIERYKSLISELKCISYNLDELNEMYLSRTNPYIDSTNGVLKEEQLEATYFVFVAPFTAKTKEQLDVQVVGRVGREPCGYEMIRHAQRLCRLMQLNAPEKVISNEGGMLIASMAIYQCGINNIQKLLEDFIEIELGDKIKNDFIYNEFSLQHELGIFLRKKLGGFYTVKFERHIADILKKPKDDVKTVKHEIDVLIEEINEKEKYAIELKFPKNGQYPEQMLSFIKDIRFCEQMLENGFDKTYCLTVVDDEKFYANKNSKKHVYKYFRNDGDESFEKVKMVKDKTSIRTNDISKANNEKATLEERTVDSINALMGEYQIKWQQILNASEKYRYYLVEAKNHNKV